MAKFPKTFTTKTPPQPDSPGSTNLDIPAPHQHSGKKRALQFKVTDTTFDEFSEAAMRKYGFRKGAKVELFEEMWALYKRQRDRSAA